MNRFFVFFTRRTRQTGAMSSTKIPVGGNKSPEYKALQGVYERLTTLFALDPGRVAMRLFESSLLPNPPRGNEDSFTLVTSIMNHVERNAVVFYKFLGVLNTLGTDADAELIAIHAKFVGKYLLRVSHC